VEADALPNALNFYPAPPDTTSPQFMYDMSQYIWGKSRVIAGFHWQSDVDASKVLVSGAYPSLHTNETFMADMRKAQAEFKKLSAAKNGKKAK